MKTLDRYQTVLRCYDNGGKTADRYTILPPRYAAQHRERSGLWEAIGASAYPFAPQGFGQHTSATPGPHLGKRVAWSDLPVDVQTFARFSFPEYAPPDLARFLDAYVACALWSSTDESAEPLDDTYGPESIAPETLAQMSEDCLDFLKMNAADVDAYAKARKCDASMAAHDFWLTRCGHGAGFWDRGLDALGDRLTVAAKVYGAVDLYVGDDGRIYA